MCITCFHEYESDETSLVCCSEVKVLPPTNELPFLESLNCSNTMVDTIPCYPRLEVLNCSNTRVFELPIFPRLTDVYCNNTPIRAIPSCPRLRFVFARNCRSLTSLGDSRFTHLSVSDSLWLIPSPENMDSLIKIQDSFRRALKRREFAKRLVLIKHVPFDLVNVIMKM